MIGPRSDILVTVLAGGLSRRFGGGDKCLRLLRGRSLLDHVLDRVREQACHVMINANGDAARFAPWRLPVVPDGLPGARGPLAGVLTALDWAAASLPQVSHVASVPADCPFLPRDLVGRLAAACTEAGAEVAVASSGGRLHPVAALWPVSAAARLRRAVVEDGVARAEEGVRRFRLAIAEFPAGPPDPFLNVNTAADLEAAEAFL